MPAVHAVCGVVGLSASGVLILLKHVAGPLLTCNHVAIGMFYSTAGLAGAGIGYALSLIVRCELSMPGYILCSSSQYNATITFHGLTMLFYFIMPYLIGGTGNILMPLLIGATDMAFPRLNSTSL